MKKRRLGLPMLEELDRHYLEVWLRVGAGFAGPYLKRPPGRPARKGRTWVHERSYRAGSRETARRVVLVVLERPGGKGELFLDHFLKVPARTTLGKRRVSVWLPADRTRMWHDLARAIGVLPPARGSPRAHTRSAA